eukprot:11179460-Lingulodinium_polyedra.AAC.1
MDVRRWAALQMAPILLLTPARHRCNRHAPSARARHLPLLLRAMAAGAITCRRRCNGYCCNRRRC